MSNKVSKFKVGDRVKRIANEFPEILIGSEWVVMEVLEGSNTIAVEGLSDYWNSDNFKLVLENGQDVKTYDHLKTKKFKVGDEVEIGIESDGGKSDYYFTPLPKHLIDQIIETGGIEIKDIIRYVFDNNADAFNIVKAQKRIVESLKGKGKVGITSLYDANKIRFFAEEQYNALNNKES